MTSNDYSMHPDDCPHPESAVQKTKDLGSGIWVQRCKECGFNFQIIGTHEYVEIEGDYLEDATYHCRKCGLRDDVKETFQTTRCDP